MIITVLTQKYKTGCGRGMAKIERLHILSHLNMIIDWSKCEWPMKEEDVEVENMLGEKSTEKREVPDTGYLGETPELKPGDCFMIGDGQVIAVDSEDRLVLIISETGAGALERIWDEVMEPEIDMNFCMTSVGEVTWENATKEDIPGDYEPVSVPYGVYKIWRDKFPGEVEDPCVKVTVGDDDLILPTDIYFLKWGVSLKPDDFMDENHAQDIIKRTIAWFYERA